MKGECQLSQWKNRLRGLGACVVVGGMLTLVPAAASAKSSLSGAGSSAVSAAKAGCVAPTITQPFLPLGDDNEYALVPGESYDNLSGNGWTLTGGGRIVMRTLYDGTQGSVLDLPAGATAVSPPMCVTEQDPTARAMVRNIAGSAGVDISVTYLGGSSVSTGNIEGSSGAWSLSRTVDIHPSSVSGWQLAQFTFIPHGNGSSDYQIYNFYVDPRMMG